MQHVTHPWINPGTIEQRTYQESIVKTALHANTLCVLPTGLGKTSIAALVVADRLQKHPDGKILFLAPTRPLVAQHLQSFEKFLKLGPEMAVITGEDEPSTRQRLYAESDVVFSTPQTIRNDLKKGVINMKDFVLCVFDEAHRCVGQYAYTYIAKCYINGASHPLILALTASPGSFKYKIDEVRQKLFIDRVEIRQREDSDVKPYVQDVKEEWIQVELPQEFVSIRNYLESIKNARMKKLFDWKIINSFRTSKSQLIKLQQDLARRKSGSGFAAMSLIAEIIKLDHALLLLETQSLHSLQSYLESLAGDETRAVARLMAEQNFESAVRLTNELVSEGREHPKIEKLRDIVGNELAANKETHIIIFAQYRSTIEKIYEEMRKIKGAAPIEFIGQAKKKGKGLSQKEQVQILNEFKLGFYNILCASQVAEEGLDITETDIVIFYEPIPSAVRKIQRAGRTARTRVGKVICFMTKGTRDEVYNWVSHHKEDKMKKILYGMQKSSDAHENERHSGQPQQKSIIDYKEKGNDYEEKAEDFKSD